jgi:hypothetical protein
VDLTNKNYRGMASNHIYLFSDTAMKFNNDLMSIPLDKVATIERMVPDKKKTRTAIISSAAIGAGILVIVITGIAINRATKQVSKDADELGDAIGDMLEAMCTDW